MIAPSIQRTLVLYLLYCKDSSQCNEPVTSNNLSPAQIHSSKSLYRYRNGITFACMAAASCETIRYFLIILRARITLQTGNVPANIVHLSFVTVCAHTNIGWRTPAACTLQGHRYSQLTYSRPRPSKTTGKCGSNNRTNYRDLHDDVSMIRKRLMLRRYPPTVTPLSARVEAQEISTQESSRGCTQVGTNPLLNKFSPIPAAQYHKSARTLCYWADLYLIRGSGH